MQKTNRSKWFETFAPSAQMFHGLGKGVGRGRGQRLAEVPASAVSEKKDTREQAVIEAA